ncbi:hypothetical protein CCACVL1_16909 [Corchorus capsularis]|uniref:Uncharacterized protein n=1 Tax=Corchorus capsularis TaxID=210143 RepID=A0A1R3HUZ3_COCAP|nr:hypothetical protein CCACVL1_16909 [Corchorus capsularis]
MADEWAKKPKKCKTGGRTCS